jgi:hypothetical protein
MEPLFDEIQAEFHYQLMGGVETYYKKELLDTLIEQLKYSPKYMGVTENACIVNSILYIKIKESVKSSPTNTRTRLIDNLVNLLETNSAVKMFSIKYELN